jgi:hypothetical protein
VSEKLPLGHGVSQADDSVVNEHKWLRQSRSFPELLIIDRHFRKF